MSSDYVRRVAGLRKAALAAKLLAHPVEDGSFMLLRGNVRVKWNPRTLRCNIDGQGIGWKESDPAKVVLAAIDGPPFIEKGGAAKNRRSLSARRRRLHRNDPRCNWCRKSITLDEATVDHRIPLARGGSNNPNNLVLACNACNQERGAHVGSPKRVAAARAERRAAHPHTTEPTK